MFCVSSVVLVSRVVTARADELGSERTTARFQTVAQRAIFSLLRT
jgi:hypothetical protein